MCCYCCAATDRCKNVLFSAWGLVSPASFTYVGTGQENIKIRKYGRSGWERVKLFRNFRARTSTGDGACLMWKGGLCLFSILISGRSQLFWGRRSSEPKLIYPVFPQHPRLNAFIPPSSCLNDFILCFTQLLKSAVSRNSILLLVAFQLRIPLISQALLLREQLQSRYIFVIACECFLLGKNEELRNIIHSKQIVLFSGTRSWGHKPCGR